MLRPCNPNKSFRSCIKVEVQDILTELEINDKTDDMTTKLYQWLTSDAYDLFKFITNRTGLIHCGFRQDINKLVYIGNNNSISDARKLFRYNRNLEQKYAGIIRDDKERISRYTAEYNELKSCCRMVFKFDKRLIKYVIGAQGRNVVKAKSIPGIKHVNIHEDTCVILGKTQDIALEAKLILDITMDTIDVPQKYLKYIIGDQGI